MPNNKSHNKPALSTVGKIAQIRRLKGKYKTGSTTIMDADLIQNFCSTALFHCTDVPAGVFSHFVVIRPVCSAVVFARYGDS